MFWESVVEGNIRRMFIAFLWRGKKGKWKKLLEKFVFIFRLRFLDSGSFGSLVLILS